jgi:hypothetical protein
MESHPEEEPEIYCKNCQTPFTGKFCPQCGQSVKLFEKPVVVFINDFLGDLFAFDTRFWRTLKAMFFFPGRMIAEYVGGRHIRYTPPFRAYVFTSFFFFLALNATTNRTLEKNKQQLLRASHELQGADSLSSARKDTSIQLGGELLSLELGAPEKDTTQRKDTIAEAGENGGFSLGLDNSREADRKLLSEVIAEPGPYLSRFYSTLSWALFLLMPLLGFFLWLAFRKSRPYFVPHFLFAINLHTFLFLLLTLAMAAGLLFPGRGTAPEFRLLALMPIYAFAGAVQLYRKTWVGTALRMLGVLFLYLTTVSTASAFLLYFAIIGK